MSMKKYAPGPLSGDFDNSKEPTMTAAIKKNVNKLIGIMDLFL